MAQVRDSAEFDEKAADLDDEQLRKAAAAAESRRPGRSDGHPAVPGDRPRGVRARPPRCGRSTSSCSARCGCWPATSSRWPPVRARRCPARSPPPATRSAGRHVHVITINDYLARRDAEWMGPLLEAMGLTVGWVTADSTADERRAAYKCDVTYASVNEIGFDVLRDQLVTDVDDLVSPNPDVALIDEADSVLVDEALVPLVLAGTTHRETPKVEIIRLVGELIAGDGLRHRRRQPQRPPHRGRRAEARGQARRHRPVLRGTRRHHADRGQRRPARARAAAARRALHRPRRRRAPDQRLAAAASRSCSAGPTGCRPPSRPRRASRPPRPARCSTPSPCRR